MCDRASAVRNVARAGVGANSQSSSGAGPRFVHDVQCDSISVGRRGAEGQSPRPARFRGPDYAVGHATLDRQHAPVDVAVAEHGQFAAASTRVGGHPNEQQCLLSTEQQPSPPQRRRVRRQGRRQPGHVGFGDGEHAVHLVERVMQPRPRSRRTAHTGQRVGPHQPLGDRPRQGRAQHQPALCVRSLREPGCSGACNREHALRRLKALVPSRRFRTRVAAPSRVEVGAAWRDRDEFRRISVVDVKQACREVDPC